MTFSKAVHLIEQFAAQAPFAVWITDSRGISIFANKKLHELFGIPEHPSGALGFDLFDDTGVKGLGLSDVAKRARAGEVIDMIVEIPRPGTSRARGPRRSSSGPSAIPCDRVRRRSSTTSS
jgi:hypothetical protein